MKKFAVSVVCCAAMLSGGATMAADFDGSSGLICASNKVIQCLRNEGCKTVPAEDVGAPAFMKLDFKKKELTVPESDRPASSIENRQTVDGKLIVQGIEDGSDDNVDGVGWSMAINQETGKMVATASGDEVGFVIFGACIVD